MKVLFVEYPKCSTCKKAGKWLQEHGVGYDDRHIVEQNPTAEELKEWHEKSGLPLILIAFLIALLVRASVGSSIVAMTMASGIMATMPAVMDTSMLYRAAMCCAICGGATALSHVNDAGFWLVTSFLEIDEKTTLKSWTIMETLIGVTALIVSFIVSIFA